MDLTDPHGPLSPYGRFGSVMNVVMSAVFGAATIVVGIVTGEAVALFVGLGFWAMCGLFFVPVMRRARRYEREKRTSAVEADSGDGPRR